MLTSCAAESRIARGRRGVFLGDLDRTGRRTDEEGQPGRLQGSHAAVRRHPHAVDDGRLTDWGYACCLPPQKRNLKLIVAEHEPDVLPRKTHRGCRRGAADMLHQSTNREETLALLEVTRSGKFPRQQSHIIEAGLTFRHPELIPRSDEDISQYASQEAKRGHPPYKLFVPNPNLLQDSSPPPCRP